MENRLAGLGKGVWAVFQFEVTTTSMTRTNQEKEQVVAKFFIAKIDQKSTKNHKTAQKNAKKHPRAPQVCPRAFQSDGPFKGLNSKSDDILR